MPLPTLFLTRYVYAILAGKIEERYGVTKAEARRQIEQWVSKFQAHKAEQAKSDAPEN